MGKSIFKGTPKKRGRPATTGRGLQIGMRWQDPDLEMIDDWIEKQKEPFTRPEAIRRLVELGLTVKTKSKQATVERATRARELAAKAIEKISDPSASQEERTQRRRRITRGPQEFREDRVDLPKSKR